MPWRSAFAAALLLLACRGAALEVVGAEWGFDGTVTRGRINILSVVVANSGDAAVEGTLRLASGGIVRSGAPWEASFFLGPHASRTVQLYPVVDDEREFALTWSVDHETTAVREPRTAPPALVLVSDPRVVNAAVSHVHVFPEELFPPTVAATDALGAVVLDHPPRWQPAQRQAFHDWVRRGGMVFLLPDQNGQGWSLGGDLAELDNPEAKFTCGAGRVVRDSATRREFTPERAATLGYVEPTVPPTSLPRNVLMNSVGALADSVRPNHAWGVIYLVLVLFLLCVGPLPWLLARRGLKARWVNLAMVGAILGTTCLLIVIGRRGYGERAVVHSLACARALGDGAWDVEQLSNLFVVASGDYRVAHRGAPNLYACPVAEPVEALITAGEGGELATSIPLFSSRSFLLRARLVGPPVELSIVDDGKPLSPGRLKLRLAKQPAGDIHGACAVIARTVYQLTLIHGADGGLELSAAGKGEKLDEVRQRSDHGGLRWGRIDPQRVYDQSYDALVAEAMAADAGDRRRLSVLLYADQPAQFQLAEPGLDQRGRVLYRIDLPLAEDADVPAAAAPPTGKTDD